MSLQPSTPAHSVPPSALEPQPPAGKGAESSIIPEALTVIWFFAALVASVYGVWAESYPALPIINLQALWDDGIYGVFLTFTSTWLWLFSPVVAVYLLWLPIRARLVPTGHPQGLVAFDNSALDLLENHKRPPYLVYALLAGGICAGVSYLFIERPGTFTPMPFVGQILLLLTPILMMLCSALLAQAAGPTQVREVYVSALDSTTNGEGSSATTQHVMVSQFNRRHILPTTAQRLQVGDRVLIAESLLGTGVLKLGLIERQQAELQHTELQHTELQHTELQHTELQHTELQHTELQHTERQQTKSE